MWGGTEHRAKNRQVFSTEPLKHSVRVGLETTLRLAPMVPKDRLVVSESGIYTPQDIQRLQTGGIGAFLIGESLMRQPDPGEALGHLLA